MQLRYVDISVDADLQISGYDETDVFILTHKSCFEVCIEYFFEYI